MSPVRLLALDTATRQATVALCEDDRPLAERQQEVTTHSEGLLSLIDAVLSEAGLTPAALDVVVCGRGPGSFTGLRIGLATAKGLCLAADKPLVCVSSLVPLGAAVYEASGEAEALVAAVVDARRQEVFCGLCRGGRLIAPELLRSPAALAAELLARGEPLTLAGDGALLYQELFLEALGAQARLAPASCHAIAARYLARAALPRLAAGDHDDLAEAVPLYIRPSDARLPAGPGSLKHRT